MGAPVQTREGEARQTCVVRVTAAIAYLQAAGSRVSLRAIVEATRILDPERPPVAVSSIERNAQAYALYEAAASPRPPRSRRRSVRCPWLERKTKRELIALLLDARADTDRLERALRKQLFPDDDTLSGTQDGG